MSTVRKPPSEGPGEGKIPITKIEAAVRQTKTAIDLWFYDKDFVSVCTLAHAGHEILRQIALSRDVDSIFDLSSVPKDSRKLFQEAVKFSPNFFKHGGRAAEEIHFFPAKSVHMIMIDSVRLYHALGFPPLRIFWIFSLWVQLTQPHLAFQPLESIYPDITPEVFDQLRGLGKQQFLKMLLELKSDKFPD